MLVSTGRFVAIRTPTLAASAVAEHPTLLGVHEIEGGDKEEKFWEPLGYRDLTQIFYTIDDELTDYGKMSGKKQATLDGGMTSFWDADKQLRSIITIKKNIKASVHTDEMKYAIKIASLLHEIGHVKDLEEGINLNVADEQMDVIEAEVYANLYAIDELAKRDFFHGFGLLLSGLRDSIPQGGYIAKVATQVIERLPEYELVDWRPLFFDVDPTPQEIKMIGPQGQRMFEN
ncbi:MAG: hypothetical protein NXI22_06625 [bacterium]|nr:hypothetical protein [bacterium]